MCAMRSRAATLTAAALLALLATGPAALAATWSHARGNAAGTGFANVTTQAATRPERTVPEIGTYAPGSGPVIGPDGTVYLGSLQGVLRAFRPDGTLLWSRQLLRTREKILSSPVIDTDGSIYVVGNVKVREVVAGRSYTRDEATLYRFFPGGGLLWHVPFPERFTTMAAFRSRGRTSAPPNIWRNGSDAAIVVPAVYPRPGGRDLMLFAFSPAGGLLAQTKAGSLTAQITGGSGNSLWYDIFCLGGLNLGCLLGVDYQPGVATPGPDDLPAGTATPLPGVTISPATATGPRITLADLNSGIVGYDFSSAGGFVERFRRNDSGRPPITPTLTLGDGTVAVMTAARSSDGRLSAPRLTFTRLDGAGLTSSTQGALSTAALAQTADRRLVSVSRRSGIDLFRGPTLVGSVPLVGETLAGAAVSRTHIFVSTASSFYSIDATTLDEFARVPWLGGGLSSPAIGRDGRIYALASNILFVWRGAVQPTCRGSCDGTIGAGGVTDRAQP